MKYFFVICSIISFGFIFGCTTPSSTITKSQQFRLDPLFTDHMVLQRNRPIKIRGWAKAGSVITVELNTKQGQTVVQPDGEWLAVLPAMNAGGPYKLTVKEGQFTKTLNDVLIGDVWVCSGQSNMAWQVSRSLNAEEEIRNADYPNIRFFKVSNIPSPIPLNELIASSSWTACSPDSAGAFSAVAYYFGRYLHDNLTVPIGLINTSWGGTVAEAWTSLEMLRTLPSFQCRLAKLPEYNDNWLANQQKRTDEYKRLVKIRNEEVKKVYAIESDKSFSKKMSSNKCNGTTWKTMKLPSPWEEAGLKNYDGVVTFRRTITIPKTWQGKELKLALGPIDEVDVTFFNGVKVGGRGNCKKKITNYWNKPRLYTVPGKLVKAGKSTITCIVYDLMGAGGLWGGKASDMKAYPSVSPGNSITLAGSWKYKPVYKVTSLPRHLRAGLQNTPSFLFNSMIKPLVNFPITGAIWYQGESNAGRAHQYQRLFPAMIQDWRIRWQQGDFPFYFVQLANFMTRKNYPDQSAWAELREAQALALRLPNTGMAVTIDIGNAKDIHPKNKQDVSKRLAHNALAGHYKKIIIPAGPLFQSVKFKNGRAILSFKHIGKGLVAKTGPLKGFEIAGNDKKFTWAKAKIKGNRVIVWNDKIKSPVAVRYAWANNPDCNLCNEEGFPASPFRTDKWPGVTFNKK